MKDTITQNPLFSSLKYSSVDRIDRGFERYLNEELELDLVKKYKWSELKEFYDRAVIDFTSGFISQDYFFKILSQLADHLIYTNEDKFYYLLLINPSTPFSDVYFDYEILGYQVDSILDKNPNPTWLKRVEFLSEQNIPNKIDNEEEFKSAVEKIISLYQSQTFSTNMAYAILDNVLGKFFKKYQDFEDSTARNFMEEIQDRTLL